MKFNAENITRMESEIKGKVINLKELSKEKTALVVVDMVNGFVYEGILSSPRVAGIVDNLVDINTRTKGFKKIFFLDQHTENSVEFQNYAKHCIAGSSEAQLIEALNTEIDKNTTMIPKNSTNGFHAPAFKLWLKENEDNIENYIIVGCEVDICVSHFATTLKTYFNQKNLNRRIIVPANCVETFDFGTHDGDLMKIISLWEMQSNGIEVVEYIG